MPEERQFCGVGVKKMKYKIKLLKQIDRLFGKSIERCQNCGRKITEAENYYYDGWCEKCEQRWWKKLERE